MAGGAATAGTVRTERERATLRGFASRIDARDAGAHNNLGVLYYRKGMTDEAVAAFARALEIDPRMAVAERNLRIAYIKSGSFERTVTAIKARLASDNWDRTARRALADAYRLAGDDARAITELEHLLVDALDDVDVIVQLARAHQRMGKMESAARWLDRARGLKPDDIQLLFEHADIAYHRGMNEDAVRALEEVLKRAPDRADAHFLMGFVLGDLGRHDDARKAARKAMTLKAAFGNTQPDLALDEEGDEPMVPAIPGRMPAQGGALVHYNLGVAFRQKGYYLEALHEFRLALDRGEDRTLVLQAMSEVRAVMHEHIESVLRSALVRAERGDHEEALVALDEAQRLAPDRADVWKRVGDVATVVGENARALDAYRRAVSIDGEFGAARVALARAWKDIGRPEDAERELEAALLALPTYLDAALELADVRRDAGRPQETIELLIGVLRRDPYQIDALVSLGESLTLCDRGAEAELLIARALGIDPDHPGALYLEGIRHARHGRHEASLAAWQRVIDLDPDSPFAARARQDAQRVRRARDAFGHERRGAA